MTHLKHFLIILLLFANLLAVKAGTYTLLNNKAEYPLGYRGIGGISQISKAVFDKQLIILLGDGDTIRDANLNVTPAADRQGLNRWQRGAPSLAFMKYL